MKRGLIFFVVIALSAPIFAAENNTATSAVRSHREFDGLFRTGMIGIADREAADNFVSLEARWNRDWHGLRPWGGLTLVDSGAWFAGAGVVYDIPLTRRSRLTLGSGPFYYTNAKEDDDLGFRLEFYSFAELSWEWQRAVRLGLRVGHLSNAGLGRRNPGTETLSFVISLPLGRLFAGTGEIHPN